jgi:hypothetical protein
VPENPDPFTDQETITASVTVTRDFAKRLAKQYSGSLSVTEALRNAAEDAVNRREQQISPEDISESTIEALEESAPIEVDMDAAGKQA